MAECHSEEVVCTVPQGPKASPGNQIRRIIGKVHTLIDLLEGNNIISN